MEEQIDKKKCESKTSKEQICSSEKRINLKKSIDELEKEEFQLNEEISKLLENGVTTDLSSEMKALHEYNDMKDIAQVVIGYLADIENVTVGELHLRYNLPTE